jgi:hypothetical protein
MKTSSLVSSLALGAILSATSLAHAGGGAVLVNRPKVVKFVKNQLVDKATTKLKVGGTPVDFRNPPAGVSKAAAKKARQTEIGFTNNNSVTASGTYVVEGVNGKPWLLTHAVIPNGTIKGGQSGKTYEYFVARTAKAGRVEARGQLVPGDRFNLVMKTSHNGSHTKAAERGDIEEVEIKP